MVRGAVVIRSKIDERGLFLSAFRVHMGCAWDAHAGYSRGCVRGTPARRRAFRCAEKAPSTMALPVKRETPRRLWT